MPFKQFWDSKHRINSGSGLGRSTAQQYIDYFNKVGPFAEDLEDAESIIDIGPGLCNFLNAYPMKERYGVDISSVGRQKMESHGIKAYAPGQAPEEIADLATCLSVIQHCTADQVEAILFDIATALKPGGVFYANGVYTGCENADESSLLKRARFSHSLDFIREICEEYGLAITDEHPYKGHGMQIWIIRGGIYES